MVLNEEVTPIPQIIIELNAPDFLEFKENIYNQGPFVAVLDRAVESTALSRKNLSRMLSYFAERTSGSSMCLPSFVDAQYITSRIALRKKRREEVKKALEIMTSNLKEYPYWNEYIMEHIGMRPGERYSNGEPSKPMLLVKDQESIRIRSYARWVTEKIIREDRAVLEGLGLIFPQDLLQEPLSLPGEASFKKWQILKASELVSRRNR